MKEAGFKLDRFEVYNWGTFDDNIWTIEPNNFSALLTGENGSGKSTLVDGLLTLLVPNVKRNYNLASGNEKKERTELTYVRGAYAREQNELGNSQTKYLRKEENYSVLLAKFTNKLTREIICIGQFFWFEQATLHKIFFISHTALTIEKDFCQIKNAKDIRARLKNIPQTTLFTTFSEYQAYFIRYVGLRSEKGLDLFNQITAIKEINRLNDFVRKHMLNGIDAQEHLHALYANYQNLELAYKAILLSKNQLDELNPLTIEGKKFENLQSHLKILHEERRALPHYFAKHKMEALGRQRIEFSEKLTEANAFLQTVEMKLKLMQEQKFELTRLFSQDEVGQEIERLKLILSQYEEKRKIAQTHATHYAKLAKTLGLVTNPGVKEFSKNLEEAKLSRASIETQLTELKEKHYLSRKEAEQWTKEKEAFMAEIHSLKNRKNRLPMKLIEVRNELIEALGISANTVPFIAELIKVKDPTWEGAIEKLLHTFALRMLIPHDLYTNICKFLNRTHIGIRLVFQKVDEMTMVKLPPLNQIDPEKLFHKLEFKSQSPFTPWLKEQIIKQYDHACVNDLSTFQKQLKAITPEGLIKHGATLNEKDDRFSIHDKSHFILGWDTREKLDWLFNEIQTRQHAHDKALQAVQSVERLIIRTEAEMSAIDALCQINDFATIDWQAIAKEIDKMKNRQTTLSTTHQKTGRIQKELHNLENDIATHQALRDKHLKETALATNGLQELTREMGYCEKILATSDDGLTESTWLKSFIKRRKINFSTLSLHEYALLEKTALDEFNLDASKSETELQQLQVSLVRKMAQFKSRFAEYTHDLDTTIESLPGYFALQKKLQMESLPEHERRFRKLLSSSIMNDMAAFKSTLDLAYEDIEETINELNLVLIGMNYSDNSYVQLQLTRNKDVEVREFHHLLKHALSEGGEDKNEICFEKIKALLDRLKTEERWCKKVTDVRNWADFSVIEKFRDTHEQKNYYSDSAGLSGGQKAKLAFTILGSAIAYQYGLPFGADNINNEKKLATHSFRFIMVDEAFSKSDEKNSRYAMALFHNLGLQVLVITPKDKIHVVEPYIHSIFLAYMTEGQDRSQVVDLALEHKDLVMQ